MHIHVCVLVCVVGESTVVLIVSDLFYFFSGNMDVLLSAFVHTVV